ncbi:MAG: phage head-tail connector protein [Lachnospiraceae bacterium]|nr:phage head-tail connector protein [Lachnospiraceae bacterium]
MELETLKGLLGISEEDTSKDISLQFIISNTEEAIENYCNIEEVPEGLTNTAYRMAMDIYRNEQPGETEKPQAVKSITVGDTSTSFGDIASSDYTESILKNYTKQLNRYRRVVF